MKMPGDVYGLRYDMIWAQGAWQGSVPGPPCQCSPARSASPGCGFPWEPRLGWYLEANLEMVLDQGIPTV